MGQYPLNTTFEYIELKDFPTRGTSVKSEYVRFEPNFDNAHYFKISRLTDKYSMEFIRRSAEYTAYWNALPGERKNDVYKELVPITLVRVSAMPYGTTEVRNYRDVFVVNYSAISALGPWYAHRYGNLEHLTFRSRAMTDPRN